MPSLFQVAERGRWGEEEFLEPGDTINPVVSVVQCFLWCVHWSADSAWCGGGGLQVFNRWLHLQNEHGEWPLYVAASHGHLEMVQDLERVSVCTACTL